MCSCRSEMCAILQKCAILKHASDCHCANFVISKPQVKGIVSDSNNIFLWHESEDINKESLFPTFQLGPISHFQVMHDMCVSLLP